MTRPIWKVVATGPLQIIRDIPNAYPSSCNWLTVYNSDGSNHRIISVGGVDWDDIPYQTSIDDLGRYHSVYLFYVSIRDELTLDNFDWIKYHG